MSNAILNAVWPLAMSATDKVVLIALADAARDPDDPQHPSQTWIAMNGRDGRLGLVDRTCLTDRAIRTAIGRLVDAGHVTREEKLGRGVLYTVHPQCPEATPEQGSSLPRNDVPPTPEPHSGREEHGSGGEEPRSPNPLITSNNHSETLSPQRAAKRARPAQKEKRALMISKDWVPPPIGALPEHLQAIVGTWSAGAYDTEAAAHRDYWLSDGRPKLEWDRVWEHRVTTIGANPVRKRAASAPATAGPAKSSAPTEPLAFTKPGEDASIGEWRTAAAVTIGASVYRRLLDNANLVLEDEQLTINVASPIDEQQLDASYLFRLQPLTERILHRRLTRLAVTRQAA